MKYDYLVVGAGLFGAVFAQQAKEHGKSVPDRMWDTCYAHDPKYARKFRKGWLRFIMLPGKFGRWFSGVIYRIANKIVRFN